MKDHNPTNFKSHLRDEIVRERLRFFIIEGITIFITFIAYLLSAKWIPIWSLFSLVVSAVVIGAVLHVCCGFAFALAEFVDKKFESYEKIIRVLKDEILARSEKPTGLSNDALHTLSDYLSNADKLYSIVYVRPSLWLRLGDLMNVFCLQAFYNYSRVKKGRPLEMIRFLVWDQEDFTSHAGIYIIRASLLVGAKTRIITRSMIEEAVQRHGTEDHLRLIELSLHAWLKCKICNGQEQPVSGRYGQLTEKGFSNPCQMSTSPETAESEQNFFFLVKIIERYSIEIEIHADRDYNQFEEESLKNNIKLAIRKLSDNRSQIHNGLNPSV